MMKLCGQVMTSGKSPTRVPVGGRHRAKTSRGGNSETGSAAWDKVFAMVASVLQDSISHDESHVVMRSLRGRNMPNVDVVCHCVQALRGGSDMSAFEGEDGVTDVACVVFMSTQCSCHKQAIDSSPAGMPNKSGKAPQHQDVNVEKNTDTLRKRILTLWTILWTESLATTRVKHWSTLLMGGQTITSSGVIWLATLGTKPLSAACQENVMASRVAQVGSSVHPQVITVQSLASVCCLTLHMALTWHLCLHPSWPQPVGDPLRGQHASLIVWLLVGRRCGAGFECS